MLLLAATGCVRQGAHSIRRCWADFNTLHEPALFWEQVDHLPYDKRRVGQFRWMYGKDPGHQYDKLKFDPPLPDEPVEIPEPVGLPLSPQSLWRDGTPEPIGFGDDDEPWRSMKSTPRLLPAPGVVEESPPPEQPIDGETADEALPPRPPPIVPELPPPLPGADGATDEKPDGPGLQPHDAPPPRQGVPLELPISKQQGNVRLTAGRRDREADAASETPGSPSD